MLSGFVCSIKALRLAREGKVEECRAIIGDSTVKRVMRLVFPASCATVVSWCTAQTGGYELARGRGSYWLTQTAERTEGIYPSIKALCMSCV
jgi:transcription initiation factor TFIID subunit 11